MRVPADQIHSKHKKLVVFLCEQRDYFLLFSSVVAIRCHPRKHKHSDDSTSGCNNTQIITSRTASTATSGVSEPHKYWHRHLISWVSIVYKQQHFGPFYSRVEKRVIEETWVLGKRTETARIMSSLTWWFGYADINKNLVAPPGPQIDTGEGAAL